jgi:DNA-directed RNA polymerase specialized sigma24 family protein
MSPTIQSLVRDARSQKPDALIGLLGHPKVKEVMRVRAHKMGGFPFTTSAERRSDCQTHLWEIVEAQNDARVEQLKRDSEWLPYLSFALRNKLLRQARREQQLREVIVVDETGRVKYQLEPKLVRADFELALAHVDALADPLHVLATWEAISELRRAVKSARMPSEARQALRLSLAGLTGKEVAERLDHTVSAVYVLLKSARQAVRGRLHAIRYGGAR